MADEQQPEVEAKQTAGVSRRDLFQILASAPAAAALARPAPTQSQDEHAHAHSQPAPKGPYQRKTFDDHQWKTVCVLCDLIIPADERSGSATSAGVPEFLDDWIAFRTEQNENQDFQAEILGGLMWLDRESLRLYQNEFAAASADQQKQILDRIAYIHKAAEEDRIWAHFFS
jgi:hypothetical protein